MSDAPESLDHDPDTEAPPATEVPSAEALAPAEVVADAAPPSIDPDTGEILGEDELFDEQIEVPVPVESPYDRPGSWYVLHTQSGYEKKVKSNLESRIHSMNMEDSIFEVVIPMEDVIEFKQGKKVVVQ